MNVVVLMGRLTKDPETRYTQGAEPMAITRYTLAVDRRFKQGDQTADFISCVCFRKAAEFADKYFRQGMRVTVSGRIQTGSYTNKDGQKVYTTEVVVDNQEFADAKREEKKQDPEIPENDFVGVPEGFEEELPFR
jgi:single-strand DNA-binding protein